MKRFARSLTTFMAVVLFASSWAAHAANSLVITTAPNAPYYSDVAFTQSGSFTDPAGSMWAATVDYGDGSGIQPLALTGQTFILNHTYAGTAPYTVSITVTNDVGDVGDATVQVVNRTPLFAVSYYDDAIYQFDPGTGALQSALATPNPHPVLYPQSVAFGTDANLYFSSTSLLNVANNSIVKYDRTTSILSTFIDSSVLNSISNAAGLTSFTPAGLCFGPDGNLYVSMNGGASAAFGGAVVRFSIANNSGVLSYGSTYAIIATGLVQPTGLRFGRAVDDTNTLYVCNSKVGNVVKISEATTATPNPNVFIAAGTAGLDYPASLIWGTDGKLYLVDAGVNSPYIGQVLRFNADGSFDSIFTQGSALQFQFPQDAVFTENGNLLIANLGSNFPAGFGGARYVGIDLRIHQHRRIFPELNSELISCDCHSSGRRPRNQHFALRVDHAQPPAVCD